MVRKAVKSNTNSTVVNGDARGQGRTLAVLEKKALSRREKLASLRKANQALMKALKLMSQRNGSITNAKSDI